MIIVSPPLLVVHTLIQSSINNNFITPTDPLPFYKISHLKSEISKCHIVGIILLHPGKRCSRSIIFERWGLTWTVSSQEFWSWPRFQCSGPILQEKVNWLGSVVVYDKDLYTSMKSKSLFWLLLQMYHLWKTSHLGSFPDLKLMFIREAIP